MSKEITPQLMIPLGSPFLTKAQSQKVLIFFLPSEIKKHCYVKNEVLCSFCNIWVLNK